MAYGCHEERYHLPIAAVDTHRPKPSHKRNEASDTPDQPDQDEPKGNASVARDYYGATIHKATDAGVVAAEAVGQVAAKILEQDSREGALAPKAASS